MSVELFSVLIKALVVLVIAMINIIVILYLERKIIADMQVRYGPMRVGFHGILQPIADSLKLILKEDIIPANVDRPLFILAPFIVFIPSLLMYLTIPVSGNLIALNLDVGVFLVLAIATVVPVGIVVAGWASYNKYSLLGAMRSAAQQISYEVPLMLSFMGVVMLAGSLRLTDIVEAQKGIPFIIFQLPAFVFYIIAALADTNRTPFDIPEAESELVQGFVTEYSSMKFALFMLAEYSNVLVVSLLAAILFLGGWNGPAFFPPVLWLAIKTYAMIFFIIWVRATLPRVRIDQLMALGWKILLPLTLLNITVTGFMVVLKGTL